jgi:hypothetical protein
MTMVYHSEHYRTRSQNFASSGIQTKTFVELDLFPPSGERIGKTPAGLVSVERAILRYFECGTTNISHKRSNPKYAGWKRAA